jgi:hypothetical protein
MFISCFPAELLMLFDKRFIGYAEFHQACHILRRRRVRLDPGCIVMMVTSEILNIQKHFQDKKQEITQ